MVTNYKREWNILLSYKGIAFELKRTYAKRIVGAPSRQFVLRKPYRCCQCLILRVDDADILQMVFENLRHKNIWQQCALAEQWCGLQNAAVA